MTQSETKLTMADIEQAEIDVDSKSGRVLSRTEILLWLRALITSQTALREIGDYAEAQERCLWCDRVYSRVGHANDCPSAMARVALLPQGEADA